MTFALAVPYITIKRTTGTCRCHGLRWGYGDLLPTAAAGGAPRCPLWHTEQASIPAHAGHPQTWPFDRR